MFRSLLRHFRSGDADASSTARGVLRLSDVGSDRPEPVSDVFSDFPVEADAPPTVEPDLPLDTAGPAETLPAAADATLQKDATPQKSVVEASSLLARTADDAPVPLDRILARPTRVQWSEGVAVIDAVCTAALAVSPEAPRIPEVQGGFLHADGTIRLHGGAAGRDASGRLARTLYDLLNGEQIPAQLRLLISTTLSAAEPHPVAQFAKELSYIDEGLWGFEVTDADGYVLAFFRTRDK